MVGILGCNPTAYGEFVAGTENGDMTTGNGAAVTLLTLIIAGIGEGATVGGSLG